MNESLKKQKRQQGNTFINPYYVKTYGGGILEEKGYISASASKNPIY